MNAGRQHTLLNPGPVNVSPAVKQALLGPDICHREPEFSDLQHAIRTRLLSVFGLPADRWTAVLLTGSGTAAVEAAVASGIGPDGRMLVLRNGVYGGRMAAMARAHGIAHDTIDAASTEPISPDAVARGLEQSRYEAVAVVHHETTTGLVNPVEAIGRAAAARGARLIVDSVSGLGGEAIDIAGSGAAIVVSTANKCLQGLPGLSFALARRDAMEDMGAHPPRSVYLHLPGHAAEQERLSTAFTPAVPAAYALDVALEELERETVCGRIERYRRAAAIIRSGCEAAGLELMLPPAVRSNTITSVLLPPGLAYGVLHDAMKREGFVIYAGQGELASRIFRVANMGHVPEDEYRRFVAVLRRVLGR